MPFQILYEAYLKIAQRNSFKQNNNIKLMKIINQGEKVSVRSKIKDILRLLFKKANFRFNKVFSQKEKPKVEIVTAFLALLELSKAKRLKVEQHGLFKDIFVYKVMKSRNSEMGD
jgi:segregation and condensation protein A